MTANLRDFPEAALRPLGIEAVSPDAFVVSMMETDEGRVVEVLRQHRAGLRRPPLTAIEYLGHLERAGLTEMSARLRDRLADLA